MIPAIQLLGGIGLFLIGMTLLTDGLTAFAGDSLRRALLRFTGTPLRAFGSGAAVTLLVQSSTATTVTLIGFVSAGLLSFSQALGVVMGASLGTTGTGWLIATLGLKISLGLYTLPLIGVGAFLKLLGRGRWPSLGLALAGFGMLFVGIDTMQDGMRALPPLFSLDGLAAEGWTSRLLALGAGIVMTVILQSSTAMVATTLTALDSGAIHFEQAAVLVIGAAIGTTMTGILAAIGGSTLAKRTALAHVLFNLSSGLIALALLPALLWLLEQAQLHLGLQAGAISLAAFHTLFIALGAALFLPNAPAYARAIERLLPERDSLPTQRLDDSQLQLPALALDATRQALAQTAGELLTQLQARCDPATSAGLLPARLAPEAQHRLQSALDTTQAFFARIPAHEEADGLIDTRLAQMHVFDHLQRLLARASSPLPAPSAAPPPILDEALVLAHGLLRLARQGLAGSAPPQWLAAMEADTIRLEQLRRHARERLLQDTASGARNGVRSGAPTVGEALTTLDILRWLERICHHAWRACHYLAPAEAGGR